MGEKRVRNAPLVLTSADNFETTKREKAMAQATMKNQERILATEKVIINNQKKILRGQDRITRNQDAIIRNQKRIIANQGRILRKLPA